MTGFGIASKDDYETIAKASPVYEAFYTNCKLKLIRENTRLKSKNWTGENDENS